MPPKRRETPIPESFWQSAPAEEGAAATASELSGPDLERRIAQAETLIEQEGNDPRNAGLVAMLTEGINVCRKELEAREIPAVAAAGRELARHAQTGGVTELSRAEAELRRGERPRRPPSDKARIMRGRALPDTVRQQVDEWRRDGVSTAEVTRRVMEAGAGRERPLTARRWAVCGYGPGIAGGVCEPMRVWWPERKREEET